MSDLKVTGAIPLQRRLIDLGQALRSPSPAADGMAALFEAELRLGLEAADENRAYDAARALHRRTGDLGRCHRAVARVLAGVGAGWAAGECSIAHEHRVSSAADAVLHRLRPASPPGDAPRVVLAVPPGERHLLGLKSLAQLLRDAGHVPDVVGDLPADELAEVARGAAAVVLSVHIRSAAPAGLVAAVRRVHPECLVVVGGPAAMPVPGADLLTSDVAVLLSALERRGCPLSERELQALRCVADGLTNVETAQALGVAAATVKTHLDHVFVKTGTTGRAAAVALALRRGWIR